MTKSTPAECAVESLCHQLQVMRTRLLDKQRVFNCAQKAAEAVDDFYAYVERMNQ